MLQRGVVHGERQGSAVALAAWFQQQRSPQEALLCLDQADWAVADGPAWLLRGVVEHALEQYNQAQISLARALLDTSQRAGAAYHLGELHRSLGQFDQATAWFLACLAADPAHPYVHNSLQYTRFSPALLPRVLDQYRQIAAADPHNALVQHLLAFYLLQAGHKREALVVNGQAARLCNPAHAAALAPPETQAELPQFLIIGVVKGGTTSLARWLERHPQIWCHPRKELHFFDQAYGLGPDWYRSQFPAFRPESGILCGEATPSYFHDPAVPARVASLMPAVKLIVLLRDPLARALSWIQHLRRLEGLDQAPEQLLDHELSLLQALPDHALAQIGPQWPGALQGSCYNHHLERWKECFPAEQILLLRSDCLFQTPKSTLSIIERFLGLSPCDGWGELRPLNTSPVVAPSLELDVAQRCEHFLATHSAASIAACV